MNHLRLLFALSVALNVGFITLLVLQIASSPRPQGGRPQQGQVEDLFADPDLVLEDEVDAADARSAAPATAQGYRRLFAALRATGLPEAEIRRVVRGAAIADWQDDVRQLQVEDGGAEVFWRRASEWDLGNRRKVLELRRDREAALAELLGDGQPAELTADFTFDWSWSDLSSSERRRVRMLEEDYALLMEEIRARSGGVHLAEDLEALRLLHEERREDLAAILSPGELEEYELRHSETSRRLRDELIFFDATEDEFRDIFRLRHELETAYPAGPSGSAEQQRRQAAEEGMNEALRELLGEQRFAEYRRRADPEFQQLAGIVRRLDLPLDRAGTIHDFRNLVREQHEAVLNDGALAPEDRREAIALLADEARQMVRDALGEKGYQAYSENGGRWLRDLEDQAAVPDAENDEES